MTLKKTLLRKKDGRWCELQVELRNADKPGEEVLSICGSEGEMIAEDDAYDMAKEYWRSFFEDSPDELGSMFKRFKDSMVRAIQSNETAEEAAAEVVLEIDGHTHGLDVHAKDGSDLLLTQCCGQIRDELEDWFPEVKPHLQHHLNNMNAGCEHQRELGWSQERDVVIEFATSPAIQVQAVEEELLAAVAKKRIAYLNKGLALLLGSQLRETLKTAGLESTAENVDIIRKAYKIAGDDFEALEKLVKEPKKLMMRSLGGGLTRSRAVTVLRDVLRSLWEYSKLEYPSPEWRTKVYDRSLGAPCPVCGYRYGSAWCYAPLPAETIEWVKELP